MTTGPARTGIALVVSGPSGAGKSSICQRLLADDPELHFSISCTTRSPRGDEVYDRDYHFLGQDEFSQRQRAGEFVEHAEVHGHSYGTLRTELEQYIGSGRDVLLDIDVQGAAQVRGRAQEDELLRASAAFVFIAPPSLTVLEQHLRRRATDSEETISRRLSVARHELDQWGLYDYLVVNDSLEAAIAELRAILAAERRRTRRLPEAPPWGSA